MTASVKLRRALLSVSDKAGLLELGQALHRHGVELLSTGGTARALRDAGDRARAGDALAYRALRLAAALTGRRDDY